jgi:hypothetical protein
MVRAVRKFRTCVFKGKMARPGRFELPTLCLEGRRSIQLSYGRVGYRNCITELKAWARASLPPMFHLG